MNEKKYKSAIFAAGCFWGVEAAFRKLSGVVETEVGYIGGHIENPNYHQVCSGNSGHAEAVRITYDPAKISYEDLLEMFWMIHDPTTLNRQGPDIGSQYRSAIFFLDENQEKLAIETKEKLMESLKYNNMVVTEISPVSAFYRAEEYHQQYYDKRGGGTCHV